MQGHMHEHCLLYTCVPFVMFEEGGWAGGWQCVLLYCGEW